MTALRQKTRAPGPASEVPPQMEAVPLQETEESAVSESIRNAIDAIDTKVAVSIMKKGSYLLKYCNNSFRKPHQRLFWVDMESLILKWQSPKKAQNKTCVYLTDVQRIVPGVDSDFWRNKTEVERQLGIELIGQSRQLRLMCSSNDEWKAWLKGLYHAHQKAMLKRKRAGSLTNDFIQKQWAMADLDNNGSLSFYELIHLLQRINFCADVRYAEQLFEQFDEDGSCVLELDDFKLLFHKLLTHQDIMHYFETYGDQKLQLVTEAGFRKFLLEVQGTPTHLIPEQVAHINLLEEPFRQGKNLTDLGFNFLMTSEFNSIMNPSKKKVNAQDMKYPLTHYWISTSHNTYLTGDQVLGKSAVGQYIDVLTKGCRCVELDCWDGHDGEPVIYHGRSLTSKIPFRAVIKACRDYGFQKSPYPIILSLEMHCSVKQKLRIADILEELIGKQIYRHASGSPVPSPHDLQNQFIIKSRVPDKFGKEIEEGNEQDVLLGEEELQLKLMSENLSGIFKAFSPDFLLNDFKASEAPEGATEYKLPDQVNRGVSRKVSVPIKKDDAEKYYNLISLTGRRLDFSYKERKAMDICSINEKRFAKLVRVQPKELAKFHQKYFSRVYPSGTRLMSSNYNPMPCWLHGVQMVALNFQALGLATILNLGRFIENGNTGYILKPSFMRNEQVPFEPNATASMPPDTIKEPPIKLTIQILAAQQLPRPIVDDRLNKKRDNLCPYVVVSVHGVKEDTKMKRTHYVPYNGLNPRWKDQVFTFDISVSSVAILVFEIRHYDTVRSVFVGAAALPVSAIRTGLRWVELHDSKLRLIPWSGLLVQVSVRVAKQTAFDLQTSTPEHPVAPASAPPRPPTKTTGPNPF